MSCLWCRDPNAGDDLSDAEYDRLCRPHQAEYEGLSLDGLDHMEAGERADMDALGYND